jgi:hypothetical protein
MHSFFIIVLTILNQRLRDDPNAIHESLVRVTAMINGRDPHMFRAIQNLNFNNRINEFYLAHVDSAGDLAERIVERATNFQMKGIDLESLSLSLDGYTFIGMALFFAAAIPFFTSI